MSYPSKLYHFGKTQHISEFVPQGRISFGLADGFSRDGLTGGQQDDEMKRTARPPPKTTTILVGQKLDDARPLQNLMSIKAGFGIRVPYFVKCFSLGYSEEMYHEVGGDMCVEIKDVGAFFQRFEKALTAQLPDWAAFAAHVQYWDFSRIPLGMNQRDLMFLKDAAAYSCQKEYRIVLLPPAGFEITGPDMRQSLHLGELTDIARERRKCA
jgi:hypothetical protein